MNDILSKKQLNVLEKQLSNELNCDVIKIDGKSGKVLVSDLLNEGYTFTMPGPVHEFVWEYIY